MAGNPANASIWTDADVYVGDLDAQDPIDAETPFGIDWDLVGLLDGEQGFVQSREEEVTDHYAWGGILVRTSRRNFKQTVTFTALEDNEVTRDLIWPDSPVGQLVVPRPKRIKIAFETREGGKIKRLISAYQAEVTVDGDITDSEGDLTRYTLLATIYPSDQGVLFYVQESEES